MEQRAALVLALVIAPLAGWLWIVPMSLDMYGTMLGPSAWMMTPTWDAAHVAALAAMWAVMMVAMMLPSAAPLLRLYASFVRRREAAGAFALILLLAAGYAATWIVYAVIATALQRLLSRELLLSPMMVLVSPPVSGALLIAAGVYQFTPLKRACLTYCSNPLTFLTRHWRDGRIGAFRLGVHHGAVCVGCCWVLMLLLFAGGVMNLATIAAIAAFVLIEKLAPFGRWVGQAAGVVLVITGAWVAISGI